MSRIPIAVKASRFDGFHCQKLYHLFKTTMDGLPLGHHNMPLSAEYGYHHAMAQHANTVSANNSSSIHSPMGQLQMMPSALNLTANSNQSMQAMMSNASIANSNAAHNMLQCSSMYGSNIRSMGMYGSGGKSKAKKPKVNKDGVPAPKRATTAYINFTQWYREEMKKAGRQIPKIGDFGKECANKWNSMTEEEKQPFLDMAAQDRERYKKEQRKTLADETEMIHTRTQLGPVQVTGPSWMAIYKPARDANKPKRPGTAFMLFMSDLRKEMAGKAPEGGVAALAKLGGERWRAMTDEEKRPYLGKQNEEKVRYEQSMEEYRRKQNAESKLQKQPTTVEEQTPNSPEAFDCSASSLPQATPTSGASTPTSLGPTSPQALSPSPQSSPSTPTSPSVGSMPLSSLTTSMSMSHNITPAHASSLGMNYGEQHTLPSYGHSPSVLAPAPNYTQTHSQTTMPSSYLPTSNSSFSQAHLPGQYNWP